MVHMGRFVRLDPLDIGKHGDDLWLAFSGHDSMWDYMGYGPWLSRGAFLTWLRSRAGVQDPMTFAVIDKSTNEARGLLALMEIRTDHGVIEIGHVAFSPLMQRTPVSTEAVYLLAKYAFDARGFRRIEWKCNNENDASRRAALRYGFAHDGVMRQHMVVKGRNRDTAWFSLLDGDWPLAKQAFEMWLGEQNIGPDGMQRHRLEAIRAALKARKDASDKAASENGAP